MRLPTPAWLNRLVIIMLGISLGWIAVSAVRGVGPSSGKPDPFTTTSPKRIGSGREIVAVFIGGSICGASTSEGLDRHLREAQQSVARRAVEIGARFTTIGVALDWSVRDGYEYLSRFGGFDEIMAGHQWLNTGAIQYIWRDPGGRPMLPQVVILDREVDADARVIRITGERVLARMLGTVEIRQWNDARSVATIRAPRRVAARTP